MFWAKVLSATMNETLLKSKPGIREQLFVIQVNAAPALAEVLKFVIILSMLRRLKLADIAS